MNEKHYEQIIKEYCLAEIKKEDVLLSQKYEDRLNKCINESVDTPACTYSDSLTIDKKWINPCNIFIKRGFTFYHHSPKEILEFSLEKRGDYSFLISQMNQYPHINILYLREYPSPFSEEKVYMVGHNGNHRTCVFRTIGLPFVTARIERPKSNKWIYYSPKNHYFIEKLFSLLKKLRLISNLRKIGIDIYEIVPETGLLIWILPRNDCSSIFDITKDIKSKIKSIENIYPDHADKIPHKLKSMFLIIYILSCKRP